MSVAVPKESLTTEQALMSDHPGTAIIARAAASGWMEGFQDWLNDELKRNNPATVLIALMRFQIMTHAGFAAQLVSPVGIQKTAAGYKDMIDDIYEEHATIARRHFSEGGHHDIAL